MFVCLVNIHNPLDFILASSEWMQVNKYNFASLLKIMER